MKSVAPCAEVGLIEGEACQFGYINLGQFVQGPEVNIDKLRETVKILTRALDDAMDISIENLAHPIGQDVMRMKRKIGIGICGLSDMFAKLNLPYNSAEARELARDLLALISYTSKITSVELAKHRGGGAEAMVNYHSGLDNKHYAEIPMLLKFARDTRFVTDQEWQTLADDIRRTGLLRNVSTIALPPTGRSSLIIGASNGIEPWFSVIDLDGHVHPVVQAALQSRGLWNTHMQAAILDRQTLRDIPGIPDDLKNIFATATELSPDAHLLMVAMLQEYNDEAISKTVNMPAGSTVDDVTDVFLSAYERGLCGITIYIDGSRDDQPKHLAS